MKGSHDNIALPAAILLAAGSASRMGLPKQLLEYEGKTLLEWAVGKALASGYGPVVVVGGAYSPAIAQICATLGPKVHFCHYAEWAKGMGGSIACGMQYLLELAPLTPGVLIFLADQPWVGVEHLKGLHHAWMAEKPPYAAAWYNDKPGAPAIFSREVFTDLLACSGDQGARMLFREYPGLHYPLPQAAFDIDTPEDWKIFTKNK